MNILVTGGAGFIGSSLIDQLLKNPELNVIAIDNFDPFYDRSIKEKNISNHLKNKNYTFYELDLIKREQLRKVFENYQIDFVFHLAAKAGVRPSLADPQGYFNNNIIGTVNLFESMKEFNVKKMVFASTSSVYGNNEKIPFSDKDRTDNPVSPYAASKKSCELICYNYHHLYNFDVLIYRFFTVYGPKQRPEMAIAKFTDLILRNKPITLYYGNGDTARDYTYIDDIVHGLILSIDKVKGYKTYNLGNSKVVKLPYLVSLIEKNLNKKAEILLKGTQPGDVKITFSDIKNTINDIGFNPKTSIEEGIKKYCSWFQKQKQEEVEYA